MKNILVLLFLMIIALFSLGCVHLPVISVPICSVTAERKAHLNELVDQMTALFDQTGQEVAKNFKLLDASKKITDEIANNPSLAVKIQLLKESRQLQTSILEEAKLLADMHRTQGELMLEYLRTLSQ